MSHGSDHETGHALEKGHARRHVHTDDAGGHGRGQPHGHAEAGHASHDGSDGHGGHGDSHAHTHAGGLRGLIAAVFRPHSHDAADKVDSAVAASAEGMRALKISLAGLGVTALIQFVVVLLSGSVGLLADTIHNFADALTAVPIGIAFIAGRRAANRRYTYGYGRGEDIAGLFVLLAMTASALLAVYEAVQRLIHPRGLQDVLWVAAAGLAGFIGNEVVAAYRIRVGRRIGSAALIADGLHARTDGMTSLAVVAGAAGVAAGWRPADPVAALIISLAILGVLRQAAREIYGRLMDRVDDKTVLAAEDVVQQVPGVASVDRLRMRWVGHEMRAEAEISAQASLTLPQSHDIAEAVRHQLLHRVHRLADATVHVSPLPDGTSDPHYTTAHHFTAVPPTPRTSSTHGHDHGRASADGGVVWDPG
jgi:cation diffusion facilitator family transporter